MVFIPNDFSNSYVVSHWTDASSYNTTTDAPFATDLINSTQLLPGPSSKDTEAAYAASPTDLVQIDAGGNIYYMTNAIGSDYTVQSGAQWTKMTYTLSGTGGSATNSAGSSASASSGASQTGASGSMTSAPSASRSSGAAATTSGGAGPAVKLGRWDLVGVAVGIMALGGALVL